MADDVEMTPISADELPPKVAPFGAPAAPAATPAAAPAAADAGTASTIRLKPVIRKPVIRKPPAPGAAPAPMPKTKTQSLKSITGPIPAQATLRKTGIVAEGILTPAQQQAAKSKTSRISLESAIGVAPTTPKGPAPLKTIRLRRPTDLHKPAAPSPFAESKPAAPVAAPAPEEAPVAELKPVEAPEAPAASEADATVTQKKTLKLHRPASPIKRPTIGAAPAPLAEGDGAAPAELGDVPEMKPLDMAFDAPAPAASAGAPGWLVGITLVASVAALLVLGAVFYFLWTEGCAPVSGANYTAFMSL